MVVARLTFLKMKPDSTEEAKEIWNKSIMPAAIAQKGYRGGFVLKSTEGDEGIAVSMWESEEDAIAGEASGYYQEQIKKAAHLYIAPPERKLFNVISKIIIVREP